MASKANINPDTMNPEEGSGQDRIPNMRFRPAWEAVPGRVSISDLPKITSFILPEGLELLPNASEVFELEFAFYEYKFLSKEEIICRGAFFKSVDGIPTHHYIICSSNTPALWEGRSELVKSYFKEGNFSTGYATHGLFPYRGKFHPQMIKGRFKEDG